MKAVIFCGPTLSADQVLAELDAEVRPPAARGDVLRAARTRPAAIGIIDGYFARVPSVWHKEILWAMAEGIPIFGAASMGALRAVELAPFGMHGVGAVYEAFASEELQDDDEVAITHGAAEEGYRPSSEALVNMRFTLRAAEHAGIVDAECRRALENAAKTLHYPQRSYRALLERAQTLIPEAQLSALRDWLPTGRIDQKRLDALQMLRLMAEQQRVGWPWKKVGYRLSNTDGWNKLRSITRSSPEKAGTLAEQSDDDPLLEELLVLGQASDAENAALGRALCVELAHRAGAEIDRHAIAAVAEDFRLERELATEEEFAAWLAEQRLNDREIDAFFRREALMRRAKASFRSEVARAVADELRASRRLGSLANRAEHKRRALSARGLSSPELEHTKLSQTQLWDWFFREKLGMQPPTNLQVYAASNGTTLEKLRAAVVREYCYLSLEGEQGTGKNSRHGNDSG